MTSSSKRLRWALGIAVGLHLLFAAWLATGLKSRQLPPGAKPAASSSVPRVVQVAPMDLPATLPNLPSPPQSKLAPLAEQERRELRAQLDRQLQLAAERAKPAVAAPLPPPKPAVALLAPASKPLEPLKAPPKAAPKPSPSPLKPAPLPALAATPKPVVKPAPPQLAAKPAAPLPKPRPESKPLAVAKAPAPSRPAPALAARKPAPVSKPPVQSAAADKPRTAAPQPRLPAAAPQPFYPLASAGNGPEPVYQLPGGKLSLRLANPPPRVATATPTGNGLAVEAPALPRQPALASGPIAGPIAPPVILLPPVEEETAASLPLAETAAAPASNGSVRFPPVTIFTADQTPAALAAAAEPLPPLAAAAPASNPRAAYFQGVTTLLKAANAQALADALTAGKKLVVRMKFAVKRDGSLVRIGAAVATPDWAVAEAAKVIRAAAPFPSVPTELPGKTVELSYPVEIYAQ